MMLSQRTRRALIRDTTSRLQVSHARAWANTSPDHQPTITARSSVTYRRFIYRRFIYRRPWLPSPHLPSVYLPSQFRRNVRRGSGSLRLGVFSPRAQMLQQFDLPLLNVPQLVPLLEPQRIHFVVEIPNLDLRHQINFVILLGLYPVLMGLAVLAHHDDTRLQPRERRHDQIQ